MKESTMGLSLSELTNPPSGILSSASSSSLCTAFWNSRKQKHRGDTRTASYSEADLANDLHSLSMKERQEMEEDIHGVSKAIPETPEFVDSKIKALHDSLDNMPKGSTLRTAWDRAVFLRPSLQFDRDHALLFLRARRFDAFAAATLLLKFYETKRELWGDALLIHRICWEDLTPLEQSYVMAGIYQLIPDRETAGRGIGYNRVREWDVSTNPLAFVRACNYIYMGAIFDNPSIQRKGIVSIGDARAPLKSSEFQLLQYFANSAHVIESLPHHLVASHTLYNEPSIISAIQGVRGLFKKDARVRSRLHCGSTIEIAYSLRTFGIDVMDCLGANDSVDCEDGPISKPGLKKRIDRQRQMEDRWRASEAPYSDSASSIALYPNPQDVILGHNKSVAPTWPGNVTYRELIQKLAPRYLQADTVSAKSIIAMEIVETLQSQHGRFLIRRDTDWETVDNSYAHKKTKQHIRDAARGLLKEMKTTLDFLS